MAVARPAFEERLAIGIVEFGGVQCPAFAFARGAVALKVAKVRNRGLRAAARETYDPRLNDDPPAPRSGMAVRCAEDPTASRTLADAAAVEPPRTRARIPLCTACQVERFLDLMPEWPVLCDTAKPEFEFVVRHRAISPAKEPMRGAATQPSRASKCVSRATGGSSQIIAEESPRWRQFKGPLDLMPPCKTTCSRQFCAARRHSFNLALPV